jgi:fumarate hydratase class II
MALAYRDARLTQLAADVETLQVRLRHVAQLAIGVTGAAGPMNAEEAVSALVAENARLLAANRDLEQWHQSARDEATRLETDVAKLREDAAKVTSAATIVRELLDIGDQRLLAGDGPVWGIKPDLSATEWGRVYRACGRIIDAARKEVPNA